VLAQRGESHYCIEMEEDKADALPIRENVPTRRSQRSLEAAAAFNDASLDTPHASDTGDAEANEDDAEEDEDEEEDAEQEVSELMDTLIDRVECRWTVVDEGSCGLFPQEGLCLIGLKIVVPPEYKGKRKIAWLVCNSGR